MQKNTAGECGGWHPNPASSVQPNASLASYEGQKPGPWFSVIYERLTVPDGTHIGWWVLFNFEPIGYFDATSAVGGSTTALDVQWYGEVGSYSDRTCTDMGDGFYGTDPSAARIDNLSYDYYTGGALGSTLAQPDPRLYEDVASAYDGGQLDPDPFGNKTFIGFAYGGPGFGC